MSGQERGRLNWLKRALVVFWWGGPGLESGRRLPRFRLGVIFLCIAFAAVLLAQYRIEEAGTVAPEAPLDAQATDRASLVIGLCNIFILWTAVLFYSRYGRIVLWAAVGAAVVCTAATMAIVALWGRLLG